MHLIYLKDSNKTLSFKHWILLYGQVTKCMLGFFVDEKFNRERHTTRDGAHYGVALHDKSERYYKHFCVIYES